MIRRPWVIEPMNPAARAGVGGPGHEERRATRPAGVALLRSVTSREGATAIECSIAVDAVIHWMGKTLLGHESISTTQIDTNVEQERIEKVVAWL